jgi:hypothetical protein
MVILKERYSGDDVIITLRTVYLIVGCICDLNILGTRMQASVHLFGNRGMTHGVVAIGVDKAPYRAFGKRGGRSPPLYLKS